MTTLRHGSDSRLAPGEETLWQGQPQSGLRLGDFLQPPALAGVALVVAAAVWMVMRGTEMPTGVGVLGGVMGGGLWLAIGAPIRNAVQRGATRYTVTDRQVFVARGHGGVVETWPIAEMTDISMIDGHPGAVLFEVPAELRRARQTRSRLARLMPAPPAPLGLFDIDDPRRVHRLLTEARDRLKQEDP